MNRFVRRCSLVAIAVAAVPVSGWAETDAELAPAARVQGSVAPEGEQDRFLIEGAEGAELTVKVTATTDDLSELVLEVREPGGGDELDLTGFDGYANTGRRIVLRKFPLEQNGTYQLTVRGEGRGEYALTTSVSYEKKFKQTLQVGSGQTEGFGIGAPPHSKVIVTAKAAKGSAAVPRFDDLFGQDVSDAGKIKARSHKVTIDDIGSDEKLDVSVRNAGDAAGDIAVTVKVIPPRTKKDKLDARGASNGFPDGGEVFIRRWLRPDDSLDIADCGFGPAAGGGLFADVGAVADPVRVLVSTADAPPLPADSDFLRAGPAFQFGPSGQPFDSSVLLRLPFEQWRLPSDVDPDTEMRVLRVGADGSTEILTPSSVTGSQAHVMVDTFSTYMPIMPKGTPRPTHRDFWGVGFSLTVVPDLAGNDTGDRVLVSSYASSRFGTADDSVSEGHARVITFGHDGTDGEQQIDVYGDLRLAGDWSPDGPEGQVEILLPDRAPDHAVPNENGTIYIHEVRSKPTSPEVSSSILLRKPDFPPGPRSLAGVYWLGIVEVGADLGGPAQGVDLRLTRAAGTLEITPNGTFKMGFDLFEGSFDASDQRRRDFRERLRGKGDVTVIDSGVFAGSLLLTSDDIPGLRVFPGIGLNVLAGTIDIQSNHQAATFFVAVRQSRVREPARLSRPFFATDITTQPAGYTVQSTELGDLAVFEGTARGTFDGVASTRTRTSNQCREVFRALDGTVSIIEGGNDPVTTAPFKLDKKGRLTFTDDTSRQTGAIHPDARFGFRLLDPKKDASEVFGLELFVLSR